MDSGSGHDLISAKKIDRMDLPTYDDTVVNFHTANGVTSSTKRSDIKFEAFDEPAQAHILEDTPSVMSMGKRCVDLGYSFIWPSGKTPYMIDPNGDIIEMTVRDYIPYINIDQKKKKGTSSKIAKIINVISDECSTFEGENMMVIDGESGDELEDLTDIVRRSESKSSKKAKVRKAKRKKKRTLPEIAVGGDPDYIEELASHDDEPDDRGDEYAEFDDDEYEPSIGPDIEEGEHDVEIEEIPEGEAREDDDDVIDVDEEDGGVRLSKRGTLKNEARSKLHLLTHRYKNPYCESCVRAKMKHRKTFRGAFSTQTHKVRRLDHVWLRRQPSNCRTRLWWWQDHLRHTRPVHRNVTVLSICSKGHRCGDQSREAIHGSTEDPWSVLGWRTPVWQGHESFEDSHGYIIGRKDQAQLPCREDQSVRVSSNHDMSTWGRHSTMFLDVRHQMCQSLAQHRTQWWWGQLLVQASWGKNSRVRWFLLVH